MERSTERHRPRGKPNNRRRQRQANFTAFDRELKTAQDQKHSVKLVLTVEEEPLVCAVVFVDQYFIKVDKGVGVSWINKSHIVECTISTNGEDR